ncbi:CPBP family intramembrane glutamic endopeptidase [Actinocorallia populi]|uniref:CPBP family intramembrane glutamic endopeptidase n=1 Tax=Actinocorallia populi TaxID=2079200 RepID=UPI000D0907F5|nr:type II CAAX endopeptidase family protein [Actinocorallia populi]
MTLSSSNDSFSRAGGTTGRGVAVFLAIAFVPAWAWLLIGHFLFGLSALDPLLQLPFAFAPAVAAFIVRRWVTGEGFADAGLALRLRASRPQYLIAWTGPFVLVAATVLVAVALGVEAPALSELDGLASGVPGWITLPVLAVALLILTPLYGGEEFGWTGYLRPRLFPGDPHLSILTTGLIWAVWHFPLAFVGYIEFGNVAFGLASWTVSFILQEYILAWLWLRSGNIWVVSLAHAGNNMVLALLTSHLLESRTSTVELMWISIVPLAAVVGWLVATGRLEEGAAAQRAAGGSGRPARR